MCVTKKHISVIKRNSKKKELKKKILTQKTRLSKIYILTFHKKFQNKTTKHLKYYITFEKIIF